MVCICNHGPRPVGVQPDWLTSLRLMGVDTQAGMVLATRNVRETQTIQAALGSFPGHAMCVVSFEDLHRVRVEVEPGQEQAAILFLFMRGVACEFVSSGVVCARTPNDAGCTIGRTVRP